MAESVQDPVQDDPELNRFFQALETVLKGIQNSQPDDFTEYAMELAGSRLEDARETLHLMIEGDNESERAQTIRELMVLLTQICVWLHRQVTSATNLPQVAHNPHSFGWPWVCCTEKRRDPGRPSLVVESDQIQFLRSRHFSWKKIAGLLGISESTLLRRREEYQFINQSPLWTDLNG